MSLANIEKSVSGCKRCPALVHNRTNTVFADGNPSADIMLIGEAPGANEDKSGVPFVGRAGQLLNNILSACRLDRNKDVYICNIVKCRPPSNRVPTPEEINNCRGYLDKQIQLVSPKYIICLGATAAQNLLQTNQALGAMRGNWYEYQGIKVLCTYHPAYLVRKGNIAKAKTWDDLQLLLFDLENESCND